MRIAIITSGILPVPAVQGGAVENLIDFYLQYNHCHHIHDIHVYSIYHENVAQSPALHSDVNHYHYINVSHIFAKLEKRLFHFFHKNRCYYHYSVDYFLHKAIRQIKKKDFDIILIENRPGFVLSLKEMTSSKIAIHQENDYLNNTVPHFQDIYNNTSLIINTSEYITQQVKTINCHDTKCRTVLNGIDVKRFHEAPQIDRKTLGLDPDDFIIVYSGRLTPDKGILQLIQATKMLTHLPKIKLLIIGGSFYGKDKKTTPFIEKLRLEAAPIINNVLFTGFIDYNQVPSYLKMADIAVVPSIWEEPFGLTVVEAMAAGLPLITTRSGGIPEICSKVAEIIERDDIVNNLVNAITDLYHHPEKRAKMSNASLLQSNQFDKDIFARNFFAALASID